MSVETSTFGSFDGFLSRVSIMFNDMMEFLDQRVYRDDDRAYVGLYLAEIMTMNYSGFISSPGLGDLSFVVMCFLFFGGISLFLGKIKHESDWTHPFQATLLIAMTSFLMLTLNILSA